MIMVVVVVSARECVSECALADLSADDGVGNGRHTHQIALAAGPTEELLVVLLAVRQAVLLEEL
jgi:hypothetical protein